MRVKNLVGNCYIVDYDFLYIKPFWDGSKFLRWSICTNQLGNEIEIGSYSEKPLAEEMMHLLSLYNITFEDLGEEFQIVGQIFSEVELCEEMYLKTAHKLDKAREKERIENEKATD